MDHTDLPNLGSPQLGTEIVFATDEWFASAGKAFRCSLHLRMLFASYY